MKQPTPIFDMLKEYSDRNCTRFHMPGHKGSIKEIKCAEYDITELSFSDNLYQPQGAIKEAEALMARAAGAHRSYMLTGGSSQGVRAMLCAALKEGDKIILSRGSHRSAGDGLALCGALPVYIPPRIKTDRIEQINAEDVEKCVSCCPEAKAILITSPDYYGRCAPLKEIKQIAESKNMLLLVDEAHGAHFPYYGLESASGCGADMWVQSMHKTMGALTQAALLNTKDSHFEAELSYLLPMLGTSSPSYLIMASMDLARAELEQADKKAFMRRMMDFRKRLESAGIKLLEGQDITRLCVVTAPRLSGVQAAEQLERAGVYPECADQYSVVFILTHKDTPQSLERLYSALNALIPQDFCPESDMPEDLPERVISPREAVFKRGHRYVPVREASGCVCARAFGLYPPGVPMFDCGERICGEGLDYIIRAAEKGREIFGLYGGKVLTCLT